MDAHQRRAPPRSDLIVVGAGIGGLTAAALAAHEGASTLVLEAHNRPGGCAGDFALGGLLFPAGATLLSGFEPGGLHDLVYRALDVPHRAIPLARAMEVVAPDRRFSLWAERDRWEQEWRRAFPGSEVGKARFLRWAAGLGVPCIAWRGACRCCHRAHPAICGGSPPPFARRCCAACPICTAPRAA